MSAQYRFNLFHALGVLTATVGAIVIVLACLAIASWIFGNGVFPYLNQSGTPLGITPDAALCFILCWVSLWVLSESTEKSAPVETTLDEETVVDEETAVEMEMAEGNNYSRRFSRRLAQIFASVAVVISLSVLAGYLFGLEARPAQASGWASQLGSVLGNWGDMSGHGILATRMAPSAAFAFLLNGVALAMLDVETRGGARPAQHLGLTALFLSLVVALGHAYQLWPLQNFSGVEGWPQMTAMMAMIFVALSMGVVFARPRNGMVSLLTNASSGGYIARNLAPATIVIPAVFGSVGLLCVNAGYFGGAFGALLVTMTSVLFVLGLIWRSAARLRDRDVERTIAETELSKAYADLLKHVREQDSELRRANQDVWAERVERERMVVERQEGLSARKRIEARLQESETRFKLMIFSAPAMIWISDADKVCNFFNKSWLDHTGRTEAFMEQSMENGWAEDIHPEDLAECLKIYAKAFDERSGFSMEYRLRRHDGQYRWVLNHGEPLFDSDGTEGGENVFVGFIGYCMDIHERKEHERGIENERDDLLNREKILRGEAEDVNRLKDEFLATVSHELRAPLNAINGWVKLLRDGRLNQDEAARALEIIERGARAQNRIISDLLDVSRIITDKLRLSARPIQPAAVIESAVESLRHVAEAKEIDIELFLDDRAGPVAGDSDRLRQIVWNLVSNAIKFTPDQGRVRVKLEREGEHVEITVSDTGIGIAQDFLPFVFDRFRQGDGSSTRRQGGLGLGLAIVRRLTDMHGGSVRAESSGPDQGATFVVKLPLILTSTNDANEAEEPDETDAAHMPHMSQTPYTSKAGFYMEPPDIVDHALDLDGLRVLAVDNDSDARDLIKTILTQYGAVVETASSTCQALALFERPEEWQPELLISDIEMPEADGYQLIRKLRELESRRSGRVPAIALTAYARTEDRLRSLSAGFHMHVTKPVEPVELLTIVASLTGRLNRTRNIYKTGNLAIDMAGQEAR